MRSSILRRLVLVVITIVEGGLVSATLVRYAPGFGADERQLDARLSSDSIQSIENAHAEERNIVRFYFASICRTFRGDLGMSRSLNRPVRQLLQERAAVTAVVAGKGLALAWLTAAVIVFATWFFRAPPLRISITLFSGTLLCLPAGVLALLAIILNQPGYLVIALIVYPKVHRYLSDLVEATRGMPHIITAHAKGTSQPRIFFWHVVPVIHREVLALAGVSIGLRSAQPSRLRRCAEVPASGNWPGNRHWDVTFRYLTTLPCWSSRVWYWPTQAPTCSVKSGGSRHEANTRGSGDCGLRSGFHECRRQFDAAIRLLQPGPRACQFRSDLRTLAGHRRSRSRPFCTIASRDPHLHPAGAGSRRSLDVAGVRNRSSPRLCGRPCRASGENRH